MSGFLLDTNIPSELTRSAPDPAVARWVVENAEAGFHVSVVSIGELHKGFMLLAPGRRRAELERWFENYLLPLFGERILPVTHAVAERWGRVSAERQMRGALMSTADGLIAATALDYGLTLVTRNTRDFSGIGLNLLNPWEKT